MFDFKHWCDWVESRLKQAPPSGFTAEFHLGQPSAKQAARVDLKADHKVMQFFFWETGEADFFGVELDTGREITSFMGRILDDNTFEQSFEDCLKSFA